MAVLFGVPHKFRGGDLRCPLFASRRCDVSLLPPFLFAMRPLLVLLVSRVAIVPESFSLLQLRLHCISSTPTKH